jgi:hypothetical protein
MRLEALKEFCRFARRNWRRACARAGGACFAALLTTAAAVSSDQGEVVDVWFFFHGVLAS